MAQDKITFQFVSSYDGQASYKIVRYGHPDHDKTIEIRYTAYALYQYNRKRYNYTIGEYMHYVVPICGYMHFYLPDHKMGTEYARAFVAWEREQHDLSKAKYQDRPWYENREYTPSIKGIAYLEPTPNAKYNYAWVRTNVSF